VSDNGVLIHLGVILMMMMITMMMIKVVYSVDLICLIVWSCWKYLMNHSRQSCTCTWHLLLAVELRILQCSGRSCPWWVLFRKWLKCTLYRLMIIRVLIYILNFRNT